ncbi:paraquat-inducible protein A [Acinetobacter sp. MD2]|uniref:paraquat-inducible protein A n=1 Tax=Acinetobacter sp. MD2 TaxID=2600066 RepID=UPI002D1F7A19|nr:paraquat-inducible protein A [Acinetobacter sp. MD2]MEB3767913.1 paraquat-inducible protein A [Acinetobacter sp. MD2]
MNNIQDEHAASEAPLIRAKDLSLLRCHCCGRLTPRSKQAEDSTQKCPRCKTPLHFRKPQSLQKTFAFLITATILYIPANILPMTITNSLLGNQQDTIMSGVVFFWQSGDYLVASVIFMASIFIPLLKLFILSFLLITLTMQARGHWRFSPQHCSVLYRVVEFIGRWSMIDVFVVSLLTALIQIQSLATILAGPGAVAFGAVVILTMLASLSFDPRMIWDSYYANHPNQANNPTAAQPYSQVFSDISHSNSFNEP